LLEVRNSKQKFYPNLPFRSWRMTPLIHGRSLPSFVVAAAWEMKKILLEVEVGQDPQKRLAQSDERHDMGVPHRAR
jgi:hypothetical protein